MKIYTLTLAEKHDKISIMLESTKGVIDHYKHKKANYLDQISSFQSNP